MGPDWAVLDVVECIAEKLEDYEDAAAVRCVCRSLMHSFDAVHATLAPSSLCLLPRWGFATQTKYTTQMHRSNLTSL